MTEKKRRRFLGRVLAMVAVTCVAACGSSGQPNTDAKGTGGSGGATTLGGSGGVPDTSTGSGGVPDTATTGAGGMMQKRVARWVLTEPLPRVDNPNGPVTLAPPSVTPLGLESVLSDGTIFTAGSLDYNFISSDGMVRRHGTLPMAGNIYRAVATASSTVVILAGPGIQEMAQDGSIRWTLACAGAIWTSLAIAADGSFAATGLHSGKLTCGALSLEAAGQDASFVVRLDGRGVPEWLVHDSDATVDIQPVAFDGAGNVVAGGTWYDKTTMSHKALALAYDNASGRALWRKDLAGEFVHQLVTTTAGDVVVVHGTLGVRSSDPSESHLTRFHGADGSVAWTRMMGGDYSNTFLAPAPNDAVLVSIGAGIQLIDSSSKDSGTFSFTAASAEAQLMPDGSVLCGGYLGEALDFGGGERIWVGAANDIHYLARLEPLADLFAIGKVGL